MGDETSKCHAMREARGDFEKYLKGAGLDIGAGSDILQVEGVRDWDWKDGDATFLEGIENESLDFVYSSHCLEHIADVPEAIKNWTRVLKPGGSLYFVVPDYTLYEQHKWTSQYNSDHKSSFSLWISRAKVGRDNHYHIDDLKKLIEAQGMTIHSFGLEDRGYDYNRGHGDQTTGDALAQICVIAVKE